MSTSIEEKLVKKVNPDGSVEMVQDKKTRERKANQTTQLSKAKRKQIARKAAKTRSRDKAGIKKANKKRKKTMKKRRNLGLDK